MQSVCVCVLKALCRCAHFELLSLLLFFSLQNNVHSCVCGTTALECLE